MAQYISKDALVAEIERRRQELRPTNTHQMQVCEKLDRDVLMWLNALAWVKKLLNTLEVKEVDLDESARHYLLHEHVSPLNEILHQADLKVEMQYHKDIEDAYKAGFGLRLKAQKGDSV